MKDQDRYFKEILGAYTVTPADETDIQKTIFGREAAFNEKSGAGITLVQENCQSVQVYIPALVAFSIIGDWDMYAAY